MKIKNVSPLGELVVPSLGLTVKSGESVDVADSVGVELCEQVGVWVSAATKSAPAVPVSEKE